MSIYIAFGANQGRPIQTFEAAFGRLESRGVKILTRSGLWQSPAWPAGSNQADYINGCMGVEFNGPPETLLSLLHKVEAEFGRVRTAKNAPRPLDLDLLDFRQQRLDETAITLPHPRMMDRGFVLLPLSQIAPNWIHPVTGERIKTAIAKLPLADIAPMQYIGKTFSCTR